MPYLENQNLEIPVIPYPHIFTKDNGALKLPKGKDFSDSIFNDISVACYKRDYPIVNDFVVKNPNILCDKFFLEEFAPQILYNALYTNSGEIINLMVHNKDVLKSFVIHNTLKIAISKADFHVFMILVQASKNKILEVMPEQDLLLALKLSIVKNRFDITMLLLDTSPNIFTNLSQESLKDLVAHFLAKKEFGNLYQLLHVVPNIATLIESKDLRRIEKNTRVTNNFINLLLLIKIKSNQNLSAIAPKDKHINHPHSFRQLSDSSELLKKVLDPKRQN